jgi:CBS domain-containing protein
MTTIAEILRTKGGQTHEVPAAATVLEAVRVMNVHRIGSVLCTGPGGEIVGILTERDLLTRVLAHERDPRTTLVRSVMTPDIVWCTPATPLDEARAMMRERRIRHIPVRDERGVPCGMVSIGDLNAHETAALTYTVATLEEYIARG